MNKYVLFIVLVSINIIYAQDNRETNSQTENKQEIKEDPNSKYRIDTVNFALTTSLLGAGYFKGNAGLLSQTSLEMYIGTGQNRSYFYNMFRVITPMISPTPNNVLTGTSFTTGIGYGNWVYKNLDSNKKGWLIGLNTALVVDIYNSYVAREDRGHLNGWISGLGLTANMRVIYQLNRDFGFVIGADISYYFPWSFVTGLDKVHSLTGGITAGIAF